ncbi:hypothetical protein BDZ91DRAFT_774606 [Kalaharituber pfeilii]|nr:hypothetical protein BDZ91DRAFT_774606 [Kalaharituber pfeilii]
MIVVAGHSDRWSLGISDFVLVQEIRQSRFWDLAAVCFLAVSPRQPDLSSCGEGKMVKYKNFESNRVIRHYHRHLSGVYSLALNPILDVGYLWKRWCCMGMGHEDSNQRYGSFWPPNCKFRRPILTLSHARWILQYGYGSLQIGDQWLWLHITRGMRTITTHHEVFTFASGSAQNIKQWKYLEAAFLRNLEGVSGIVVAISISGDDILFSCDNKGMCFFDWNLAPWMLNKAFFSSTFDKTGSSLFAVEANKTVKSWKQNEDATEETLLLTGNRLYSGGVLGQEI